MSGHFLQRGEAALVDKWVRTEMALTAGVDAIFELPCVFACNSAPAFASGAVQSLAALGVVDAISFGSESGHLQPLRQIAQWLADNERALHAATASRLRRGINYPAARSAALAELAPHLPREHIVSPNNILGIEYLKALRTVRRPIDVLTLPRLGTGFHSRKVCGNMASATAIRDLVNRNEDVSIYLPPVSRDIFLHAVENGHCLDNQRLFLALQSFLLQEPKQLDRLYQVEHGLESRLVQAAMTATSYNDLVQSVKSRVWTMTRIQRILTYVLLQVGADEMKLFLEVGPLYLRLLGTTETGKVLLRGARRNKTLPIINDPSRANAVLGRFYQNRPDRLRLAQRMLAVDLRATRIHSLLMTKPPSFHANRDFFEKVRKV